MGQLLAVRYSESDIIRTSPLRITPQLLLELQDNAQIPIPVDLIVDCMDCWELCCGYRGIPQDKSVRLAILSLREERRSLRLRRLYPHSHQVDAFRHAHQVRWLRLFLPQRVSHLWLLDHQGCHPSPHSVWPTTVIHYAISFVKVGTHTTCQSFGAVLRWYVGTTSMRTIFTGMASSLSTTQTSTMLVDILWLRYVV